MIGIGIIGCGTIAVRRHSPEYQLNSDAWIVGCYDFMPEKASELAKLYNGRHALIAPRPHLGLAGNYDKLTPPQGLDKIELELNTAYKEEGAPNAWKLSGYDCGHNDTEDMRREIISFFQKWL